MPMFEIKRGVEPKGFHSLSEKYQGWILKIFCLTLKWKYPISSVWLESKVTFAMFGATRVLWEKKWAPIVPYSATGVLTADEAIIIRRKIKEAKRSWDQSGPHLETPYVKWRNNGAPMHRLRSREEWAQILKQRNN